MSDNTRIRLCGLWARGTQSGQRLLSGTLTVAQLEDALAYAKGWGRGDVTIVAFENRYGGDKGRRPDYALYLEQRGPSAGDRGQRSE